MSDNIQEPIKVEVPMYITKDSFTNDKGEKFEYYVAVADIDGEEIRFTVKQDYKKLFEHLISKYFKVSK